MAMPEDLVLVRHEQSEANLVQKQYKQRPDAVAPEGFFDRHDSRMRLSNLGRERAPITGAWLRQEFPEGFDRYYTSPLARAAETAGRLALGGVWNIDDRWRERDWGEYGILNDEERERLFSLSVKIKGQTEWYWCPPGGESLATGVSLRQKDVFGTLAREMTGKRVIAVTHGEVIEVDRVIVERLLPEVWHEQKQSTDYRMNNCQVLHYSRRDPETGELGKHLEWRRSVCAWDPTKSWQNGEWVKIERHKYSDNDLLQMVEAFPRLLED